jgi:hypothetical protein
MAGWLGGMMQRAAQNNPQMAEMMANRERRIGEIRSRIAPWMQQGGGPLGVMRAVRNASAPVSQEAPQPDTPQPVAPQPVAAPQGGGFQEKLADVVSGGFSDPYEAQKQARLGPRQRMM